MFAIIWKKLISNGVEVNEGRTSIHPLDVSVRMAKAIWLASPVLPSLCSGEAKGL